MASKVRFYGVVILGLLIIVAAGVDHLLGRVTYIDGVRDAPLYDVELHQESGVSQVFVATRDRLSSVAFRLTNWDGEQRLRLRLWTHPAAEEAEEALRVVDLGRRDARPDGWLAAEFEPIAEAVGKAFRFTLEAPGLAEEEALRLARTVEDIYVEGAALIDGEEQPYDLGFLLEYEPTTNDRIAFLADALPAGKPLIWGANGWYLLLGVGFVGLSGALIALLMRA